MRVTEPADRRTGDVATRRMSPGWTALIGVPSLALGIGPLVAAGPLTRVLGLPQTPLVRGVIRLVGVRELVVAVLFLVRPSSRWMYAFLAQDAADLGSAAVLLARGTPEVSGRFRRGVAVYAAVATVDVGVARHERQV